MRFAVETGGDTSEWVKGNQDGPGWLERGQRFGEDGFRTEVKQDGEQVTVRKRAEGWIDGC